VLLKEVEELNGRNGIVNARSVTVNKMGFSQNGSGATFGK